MTHPSQGIWVSLNVMTRPMKLTKFPMLIAPLSLVHLIIGMDTTSGNLLNWNKPKSVVIAVGVTRWEPVDLPLRLLICVNTKLQEGTAHYFRSFKAGV